ncbi:Hypothetical Protein RradSPS_2810 (plasmid) [Rubrobacter radiotolerans]|uniref:Uncharacterized protein n=1 Tax=Rubrobacter radiotolerans TaxID=42256 RepID=A0A023X708_RUBRA|nr:hypothetical protein [Rubrobacter radiotolerans]AHY48093.1 Hypothetical Protein RradSPS_2810 [Rubrobacter radiotolerans]MDX5895368.1 hypothetical protein [Rubrobacter radiotolerans]SMC01714.1 conserved hypothetical protein [Rubrobacter radiotolerans DSM 5868]
MGFGVARGMLLAVDGCVALTAIGGGLALVAGLEGDRFPLEWLEGTPFDSYAVPGWILAVVVGGSAAAAAIATLLNPRIGGPLSVVAGVVMMGWIVGEVLLLRQPSWTWTELLYFVLGALMGALGISLRLSAKKS